MYNSINNRIRRIIKAEKITQEIFCEKIGTPLNTLKTLFQRDSNPNFDLIRGIAENFPDYSLDWLITGNGEMLKSTLEMENKLDINNPERIKELELAIIQKDAEVKSLKCTIEMLIQTIKK